MRIKPFFPRGAAKALLFTALLGAPTVSRSQGQETPDNASQQAFLSASADLKAMRWKRAETGFRKVLQSDPQNLKAHFCLGEIEYYNHRLNSAEGYFQWVNFHDPHIPINYYYLGRVAYDQKRYEQSLSDMQAANRLDSQIAMVHYYMGLVYYHEKRVAEAQAELAQASSLDPSASKAHYALAYLILHDLHRPDLAQKEVDAALNGRVDQDLKLKLMRLKKEIRDSRG